MGIFDLFRRKQQPLLDVFQPSLNPGEVRAAVPGFAKNVMHAVHRFAVQFYRDIHSHDSDGFPAVREELCYLLFFSTDRRIRELYGPDLAEEAINAVRADLTRELSAADSGFSATAFWQVYTERVAAYSAGDGMPLPREKMVVAFNANLLARLHDWGKLVAFHGAAIAAEALTFLEGEHAGSTAQDR